MTGSGTGDRYEPGGHTNFHRVTIFKTHKWRGECTCGWGCLSWSWSRVYDFAHSGQTLDEWVADNGQAPTGGVLPMALEHLAKVAPPQPEPEYWPTRQGQIAVVADALDKSLDPYRVVDALDAYQARFAYRCQESWCPKRRDTVIGRLAYAGFPTVAALEEHRIRDHKQHGLRTVRSNGLGWLHFVCECGHTDGMATGDFATDGGEPESRAEHLRQVAIALEGGSQR